MPNKQPLQRWTTRPDGEPRSPSVRPPRSALADTPDSCRIEPFIHRRLSGEVGGRAGRNVIDRQGWLHAMTPFTLGRVTRGELAARQPLTSVLQSRGNLDPRRFLRSICRHGGRTLGERRHAEIDEDPSSRNASDSPCARRLPGRGEDGCRVPSALLAPVARHNSRAKRGLERRAKPRGSSRFTSRRRGQVQRQTPGRGGQRLRSPAPQTR
ncbi:MAG: hypothetical protein KatS3mg060_1623 [Dehalococcoidia bacterium]|nr:MAG: hypothetical protein KatS3mg060_1623 [Dehalococcoidia bacterium]